MAHGVGSEYNKHMLINFYGKECPHCDRMKPLIEKLMAETGVVVLEKETWHDAENEKLFESYDKGVCGGVPYFYNTETNQSLCGESSYEELKKWAGK